MTLTLAARWRLTVRVQSLARVTYPAPPAAVATPRKPDLLAIAEANRMHEEMVGLRQEWQERAMLAFPRIF